MKYFIILILSFLLFSCSSNKKVYWCGDHACINNKEKEAYFKKTMIVEIRMLGKKNKKTRSEFEKIKKHAGFEEKKTIKNKKELAKDTRLEKKKRVKEQKELAKQARLDEKKRVKEQKELAKQARLDEKKRVKEQKELVKQVRLEEKKLIKKEKKAFGKKNISSKKEIVKKADTSKNDISSAEFKDLVEKITKKNMLRPYPNINDIKN